MDILKITKTMLDADNFYIGAEDVDKGFDGHIEIAAGLGRVKFKLSIIATGRIIALLGSGIEAGWGIKAGSGIKAGDGIEAGWGIEAGSGIKAGWGIEAGLSISAKWLSARLRIFAGLCLWRLPTDEEQQIRAEIRDGTVAFGTAVSPSKSDEAA